MYIDSDGIINNHQQVLEQKDCKISDGRENLHQDRETGGAFRLQGTITSARDDSKYGYIDGDIFVHHDEFHNGSKQLVVYWKVKYEAYY